MTFRRIQLNLIRPNLTATRESIADPLIVVERWADQLQSLVQQWPADPDPLSCYDLSASLGRLQRTRPALLRDADASNDLADAATILAQNSQLIIQRALEVPNVAGWMEDVARLEASYVELIDPIERNLLAEQLLMDLDDAELVAYAAWRHGIADTQLDEDLEKCRTLIWRQAHLFLPASVFVQAVGMTVRPELLDEDYELAATTLKFTAILDAAEEAEAALTFANVKAWHPYAVRALIRRFAGHLNPTSKQEMPRGVLRALADYRQALGMPLSLAAAPQPPSRHVSLRMESPDAVYVAYLRPDRTADSWSLRCYTAEGDPAAELAGRAVRLDGVPATLDARGQATFPRQRLAEAPVQEARLEVQDEQGNWVTWNLQEY